MSATDKIPEFEVHDVIVSKPKVLKPGATMNKISSGSQYTLRFFPDYVEVMKKRKKKDKLQYKVEYRKVEALRNSDDDSAIVWVTTKDGKKTNYQQFSIKDANMRQKACDYLERKPNSVTAAKPELANGGSLASPPHSSYDEHCNEKPKNCRREPRHDAVNAGFSADGIFKETDFNRSLISDSYSVSNVHYNSQPKSYRSQSRASFVQSEMSSESYDDESQWIPKRHHPRSSFGTASDFDSEVDSQTQIISKRHKQPASSYAGRKRGSRIGSEWANSSHASYFDQTAQEEEEEEAEEEEDETETTGNSEDCSTCGNKSENTIIDRPSKPRSLPYYTPLIYVNQPRRSHY